MNKFIERLQKHPLIILSMFLLTLVSALVTIVLGWEEFYNSFLSKQMSIPVWVILLILLVGAAMYIFRSNKLPTPKELETVEGKEFGVQQIELDGKNFVNCTFDGSELVFREIRGFSLQKNHFKSLPRITFQDYAANTVNVMKSLYKDPSFKPYIEKTFEQETN